MTHRWYIKQTPDTDMDEAFKKISRDFQACLNKMHDLKTAFGMDDNLLLADWDGHGKPAFSDSEVRFNGPGLQGGETFVFSKNSSGGLGLTIPVNGRNFLIHSCDTKGQGYDLAVRIFLVVAKFRLGDDIVVAGDDGDWKVARKLCHDMLGYGGEFHPETDPLLYEEGPAGPGV